MSTYSMVEVELEPNKPLSEEEWERLKEKTKGTCGSDDYFFYLNEKVKVKLTLNNGWNQMQEFIEDCKRIINYENVKRVGTLSTEAIWSFYATELYAFQKELFVVSYEPEVGYGYKQHHFTISNLKDIHQTFSITDEEFGHNTVHNLIQTISKQ